MGVSPSHMIFHPEGWNVSQELTILAFEDDDNLATPYQSAIKLSLSSEDMNYNGTELPDMNVTLEDNDDGEC